MTEEIDILQNAVNSLAQAKKYNALRDLIVTLNPADLAILLQRMPEQYMPIVYRLLPHELAAETFVEMDSDSQETLIRGFSDTELKAVVDELYMDDAVDLVEEMPGNVVKRILQQTEPQTRKLINEILRYPEDSAGSIMTTEFMELHEEMSVADAIELIRRTGKDCETVNNSYVTDDTRHLIGTVSLKTLILADDDKRIGEIMEPNVISAATMEDQESVVQLMSKYDFNAVPIVDGENRLVGIVTVDDAMDVFQEETTEDMEKMAAIAPSDKPYVKTSIFTLWKNRILWLLPLMLLATVAELVIRAYGSVLSKWIILASFIPVIMGTSGNAGSQSAVTVIRALSLGELQPADYWRVVLKESAAALLCGLAIAAVNFVKLFWLQSLTLEVSLAVSLSLVVDILLAKLLGALLPMMAQRLGKDPAVLSSPLLTTMMDALALWAYFALAAAFLK